MPITGWIHHHRDLRDERTTLNAMAAALGPGPVRLDAVRPSRRAAFACHGRPSGSADWRHPERPDPDLTLAIHGRLTNRRRIEEELYRRARPLSSDAEVLLHAYRAWGAGLAERVDGSYAIAIWDNTARQLLLIRDPLGSASLFYALSSDGLAFATRVTALLAHPEVKSAVDSDGMNELLLGPVRSPGHGVIRGVTEVLPGELIRFTPAGLRRYRYWSLGADEHGQDFDATVGFVRRALADYTAPPRVGAVGAVLLSGGVASAGAAAFAAGAGQHRPAAWTLALAEKDNRPPGAGADAAAAVLAAQHLQLPHTVMTADTPTLLASAVAVRDILDLPGEPGLDAATYAVLHRAAAAGASSVITGDGADAVFGGYPWLHDAFRFAHDQFPWQPVGLAPADLLNDDARHHLQPGEYLKQRYAEAINAVPHLAGADAVARRHRTLAHLTLTRFLPQLLIRLNQLATGSGLTLHTPFADWLLAEYAFNLPAATRQLLGIPNGLLRHCVADLLPAKITWLRPRRFPSAHLLPNWQRDRQERLRAILTDSNAPLRDLLDPVRVAQVLAAEPRPPRHDWHTTIDHLAEIDTWMTRHNVAVA